MGTEFATSISSNESGNGRFTDTITVLLSSEKCRWALGAQFGKFRWKTRCVFNWAY